MAGLNPWWVGGGPGFGGKMEVRLVGPTGEIELKTKAPNPENLSTKEGEKEKKFIIK